MKTQTGFTLIETLIYLALFGIIMGGVAAGVYSIVELAGRNQAAIIMQEEGDFLLAKFDWALGDASAIIVSSTPLSLSINKYYFDDNPLIFSSNNDYLELQQGTEIPVNLNNNSVAISNLIFQDLASANGRPEGVNISFSLTGKADNGRIFSQDFETTKYLKK